MITLSFGGSDSRVVSGMKTRAARVGPAVVQQMNALHAQLQGYIVTEKLSGQVLQHHTGKLAGSLRLALAEISGDIVSGGVLGGGGVAPYGRYHEYGTVSSYEIVPHSARALAFQMGGHTVFAKRVIHPPIQERSFMRSSLAEMKPQIVEGLRSQIALTLAGNS